MKKIRWMITEMLLLVSIPLIAFGINMATYKDAVSGLSIPAISMVALPAYTNLDTFEVRIKNVDPINLSRSYFSVDSTLTNEFTGNSFVVSGLKSGNHRISVWGMNDEGYLSQSQIAEIRVELEWSESFIGKSDDCIYSVCSASTDKLLMTGYTRSAGLGNADVWLAESDITGRILGQFTLGGTGYDSAACIIATKDGGSLVAGFTKSFGTGNADGWIIKLDAKQQIQWQKCIGGVQDDKLFSCVQTAEGDFVCAGFTYSTGSGLYDVWVIRLDRSGEVVWQKTYGGKKYDEAHSIVANNDGTFVVAGFSSSFSELSDFDAWAMKLDANGSIIWQKTYATTGFDRVYAAKALPTGGYIFAGETDYSHSSGFDFWVFRVDANGDMLWQKTYGFNRNDTAYALENGHNGSIVVAGKSSSASSGTDDFWAMQMTVNGEIQWQKSYGEGFYSEAKTIVALPKNCYLVAGQAERNGGGYNGWAMKIDAESAPFGQFTSAIVSDSPAKSTNTSVLPQTAELPSVNTTAGIQKSELTTAYYYPKTF